VQWRRKEREWERGTRLHRKLAWKRRQEFS